MNKRALLTYSLFILAVWQSLAASAGVGDTFYVAGNRIYDPCGDAFTPRGINYAVLDDWRFPANMNAGTEMSAQIAQANPNVVRIPWWRNYDGGGSGRPAYGVADLDSVVSRFSRAGIVSIVTIADETGGTDTAMMLDSIVSWWTSAPVVAVVQKHKNTMMLNIANEWGYVAYAANPAAALIAWQNTYKTAISSIRGAGITVPLVIDGPDYANLSPAYASSGSLLTAADPLHNVILSVHAYWSDSSSCVSYDSATIRAKLLQMDALPFPVIIGETAVRSPSCDGAEQCAYYINLNTILTDCVAYGMGWLVWVWYDDVCGPRQISTDGTFAHLSATGDTVVNNTTYGLATNAVKTNYMLAGQTCPSGIPSQPMANGIPIQVLTEPSARQVLAVNEPGAVYITDIYGRVAWHGTVAKGEQINLSQLGLAGGIYTIVHFSAATGRFAIRTFL